MTLCAKLVITSTTSEEAEWAEDWAANLESFIHATFDALGKPDRAKITKRRTVCRKSVVPVGRVTLRAFVESEG